MNSEPDRKGAWREVRLHVALWTLGQIAGAVALYVALNDIKGRRAMFEVAALALTVWSPLCLAAAVVRIKHVYAKTQNTALEESDNARIAVAIFCVWGAARLLVWCFEAIA